MLVLARRSVGQLASPRFRVITQTAITPSRFLKSNLHFSSKMAAPVESPTIFDRILRKEIPSTMVYEDDLAYAFRDIAPVAPTHVLVIPKVKDGLSQLSKAEERHRDILGHLLYVAKLVAEREGLSKTGYRIVINDGDQGCQAVYHLHLHVIGGKQLSWPPGA